MEGASRRTNPTIAMNFPMRILHVASHAQVRRGGAVQLCRMATGLHARGHEILVVANDGGDGLEFDEPSWTERLPHGVKVSAARLGRRWGLIKLWWTIHRFGPDIIHAHRDDAVRAVARVCRNSGHLLAAQRGTTRIPKARIQSILRSDRIAAIVTVAERVRQVLIEDVKVAPQKIKTIYGSVDVGEFVPRPRDDAHRQLLGFHPSDFVIGSLSAFREEKGLRLILDAAAMAMRDTPNLKLLFLGSDVEVNLQHAAHSRGIADRCRFVGHQADVPRWLSAMDATVVAASSREGLSGVLRESLACGIPVISTNSDGNPEIVRHGETGLLVPVGDELALASAFHEAASNPEKMRRLADNGRRWILEHCTVERQAARLEGWYNTLLASDNSATK